MMAQDELRETVTTRAVVVDTTGSVRREFPIPTGFGLLNDVAWSPDGRWIAMVSYNEQGYPAQEWQTPGGRRQLVLVDAAGDGRTGPAAVTAGTTILGWLAPDRLLQARHRSPQSRDNRPPDHDPGVVIPAQRSCTTTTGPRRRHQRISPSSPTTAAKQQSRAL
jgi:hypothetical protein